MVKRRLGAQVSSNYDWLRIFTGNSNIELVRKIAKHLGTPIGKSSVKNFSDGEISVEIDESVRGMDVFVVHSICAPVDNNLMELLIMMLSCSFSGAPDRGLNWCHLLGRGDSGKGTAAGRPITCEGYVELTGYAGSLGGLF